MKLLRFGAKGYEKPGILDPGGVIRDVSGHVSDFDGAALTPDVLTILRQLPPEALPAVPDNVRIGPCVANVGKFVCIGLNYADHAAEIRYGDPGRAGHIYESHLGDLRAE